MPKEVLHQVQVHGLKLEFRAPGPGRTVGSIACIDPDGTKQVEIFTSFDTLEAVIEGIAKLKERMRDETITLDITPPKRP